MRIVSGAVFLFMLIIGCGETETHGSDRREELRRKSGKKITFEVVVPAAGESELSLPGLYIDASGKTLLETMLFLKREELLEFEYSGAGEKAFIYSIAGIESNTESKNEKNWIYAINGRLANRAAGSQVLNHGDYIRWCYLNWEDRMRCSEGQRQVMIDDKKSREEIPDETE